MKTSWEQDGEQRQVVAPVSLIVTAFAPVADVRASLTPQLRTDAGDSVLILVDLGRGRHRMGGSILAQAYNQVGETVPDIDAPQDLRASSSPSARWPRPAPSWPTTTVPTAACSPR